MEAVPKLAFISFELKVSPENTHFGPKLKQYIAEAYREDPESYGNEIHQLEGLRSAAVRPTIDVAGLKALNRYFCQLRAMQSRFPMGKGQPAACTFVWKDLYANMNCTLADLRFEMACILYNIGALHTQLASSESRSSADSLKMACQHFQNAAWTFQYLREQYPQPSGADVSSEILKLLQEICFAQAQECILDKSRQDTRKPNVIGAVATQVLHFYKNSMAILGPSTGTDNIHEIIGTKLYNNWYRHLSFKASYIGCIVALYQGINAEEHQKMGERVAYYQLAVDKLNEARKLAKYIEPVQVTQEGLTFTNDIVEGKRKAAKNENEFIYHEEVPDKDMLTEVKPVCLVKALAIDFNDPEVSGSDVFSRLVPLGAHEAASLYSERKAQLLRQVGSQADAKDLELTEFLSSLQLDQLDHLDDDDKKIPQEVVDRCAAMNAKTDMITTLVDSMNSLAEVITDVEHTLADIKAIIQEENEAEKEYQKTMGARPPSLVQTELARELHKYSEAHARTADSNAVLHKAMTLHIANLQLLARPLPALIETLPSIARLPTLDRDAMREMRRVLAKAHEMRTQRAQLLDDLRAAIAADDVTPLLLADPTRDRDELFDHEIEKHTPKVKIIEQNLAAQENIINRLTSLYAAYGDSRRLLTDVLRKRDALLNGLVTSYDSFGELVSKSTKGLEFYRKLQNNLTALLARARSVCQVQREERAQRSNAAPVTKNSAAQPAATAASAATPTLTPTPTPGATPKLKDYLPYMKNRTLPRNIPPQVPPEMQPTDAYPEPACPPSIRPAPVGSEATDIGQGSLPDGMTPQGYGRYPPAYAPTDADAYQNKYGYPTEEMQNYNYSGYPQQFSTSTPEQESYTAQNQAVLASSAPAPASGMTSSYHNNYELSNNFSQMHVSAPKSDVSGGEYSQTYFSVQYPPSYSDVATYSRAPQGIQTSSTAFTPVNYPYVASGAEYSQPLPTNSSNMSSSTSSFVNYSQPQQNISSAYASVSNPAPQYQSYPVASDSSVNTSNYYPNSFNTNNMYYAPDGSNQNLYVSSAMSNQFAPNVSNTASVEQQVPQVPGEVPGPYEVPTASSLYVNPALAQIDELDKPIKSHAKGEALSTMPISSYQNFNMSATVNYPPEQVLQTYPAAPSSVDPSSQYGEVGGVQYGQSYQNHPGYTYNAATGNYDYSYGSQNSYLNYGQQTNVVTQQDIQSPSWQTGLYTSAGGYNTVQSPSEAPQPATLPQAEQADQGQQQTYYTASGQYPTTNEYTSSATSLPPAPIPPASENNVISEPANNVREAAPSPLSDPAVVAEEINEPTNFDLLSDIDFSVEQKPLTPEIKVPQVSEKAIIAKSMTAPKVTPTLEEEPIRRPAKRDLFSDPSLINRFTQEVKSLQKLTDSFMNKTPDGLTLLDAKWKDVQEIQEKENAKRAKRVAVGRSRNITSDVVPYDDSRLTLKSDPDAYINASFYKQLTPWCIPLVIAKCPDVTDAEIFWKGIFEKKITCIVCLLTETEMQGATYFPSASNEVHAGSVNVSLTASQVGVYWTERRLRLSCPPHTHTHTLTHLQLHVAPARSVCSPLVLVCDAVLRICGEGTEKVEGGVCIHCDVGAGRSALLALVLAVICQVRAGQVDLAETLSLGCAELCKGRSGVLPRPDVIADAYRTALFYSQGVLCSGSTMFNGEAVSVSSVVGPALPGPILGHALATGPLTSGPALTGPPVPTTCQRNKFSRESFEEMRQAAGLKSGDMKDPLNFLDPLWTLKKK